MSSTIYTSVAPSVFVMAETQESIEAIIESVRNDTYKNVIARIRDTKDDTKRKKLKQVTLPVFYPTVRLGPNCRLNEGSEPTGIVQFDIDEKENPGVDIPALQAKVTEHSACMYAFISPSGGLKFGILTDFTRASGEAIDITNQRFKIAYRLSLQAIRQHCGRLWFKDDDSVDSIRQSCYLSHDPNAFYRADCMPLAVNDQCHVSPREPITETMADFTTVQLILDHIPQVLPYGDRFKVNVCVLSMLGRSGIPMLMNHWQKKDRAMLKQQLEDTLRGSNYGSIYMLQSYAKKYGNYKPSTGGAARRKVQPMPCDHALAALSTPAEATAKLQEIIREFVNGKRSHFVNVTTGAGKTRTVLEALSREVSHNAKVLVLVPTHKLADDIIGTYKEIRAADVANADTLRGKVQRSTVVKFHSRKALCENEDARTKLEERGVSIPVQYCLSQCPHQGVCHYTLQFSTLANIRVMTHNEWVNQQSAWFKGFRMLDNGEIELNRDRAGWVPDYIVIDEDILKLDSALKEAASERFPSVELISASVNAGSTLHDAVWQHREQVLHDAAGNQKPNMPSPDLSPAEYFAANRRNTAKSRYSKIIAQLASYCRSDDPTFLDGMWVEQDTIKWLQLPAPAKRYEGIPTLYLDATAHPAVVERLLPGVRFHRIAVRQNEDVRLFQLSNATITKGWLEEPGNVPMLISGLKEIVKPYRKVGLVTYKTIGKDDQFATTLARAIGAEVWAHFGNLRGINTMEDVDCLLVVGRYSLRMNTMQDYARAIFGADAKWETIYADLPVRMKDGTAVSLNTLIVKDPMHQTIYEHTSVAETLQAIGRGRPVHGSKKDIYVFSNENLTINTEVADFFPFERYFERPVAASRKPAALVTAEALERVRERGYVQLKAADLMEQFGLTAFQVKAPEKKDQIAAELVANRAARIDVVVRYRKGNTRQRTYVVFDMAKLEQALADQGERLIG